MKSYWHKLSSKHQKEFLDEHKHMLVSDFMDIFSQPEWCSYPEALADDMGCWGLGEGNIHKVEDCGKCEYKHALEDKNERNKI